MTSQEVEAEAEAEAGADQEEMGRPIRLAAMALPCHLASRRPSP